MKILIIHLLVGFALLYSPAYSQEYDSHVLLIDDYFKSLMDRDLEKYISLNKSYRLVYLGYIGYERAMECERETLPRKLTYEIVGESAETVSVRVWGIVGGNYVPEGITRLREENYVGTFELEIVRGESRKYTGVRGYSYGVSTFVKPE